MSANGEDPHLLAVFEAGPFRPRVLWSPDGQRIAYLKRRGEFNDVAIEVRDLNGGKAAVIFSDRRLKGFCWTPDGQIICDIWDDLTEPSSNLWEIRGEPREGRISGKPRRLTNWAGFSVVDLTATADGKRLSFVKRRDQSDVYVAETEPDAMRLRRTWRLTRDDWIDWPGGWTRDGKSLLFYSDRNGSLDIFKQGVDAATAEEVVGGPEDQRLPQLSPDGSWILYLSWPDAKDTALPRSGRLMRIPVSGGSPEVVLSVHGYPGPVRVPRSPYFLTAAGYPYFRCPSLPSASCVLSEEENSQLVFSTFDPAAGTQREIARIDIPRAVSWDLSPDGSRIACGEDNGRVRILSAPGGSLVREVEVKGWSNFNSVAWSASGKSLLVTTRPSRGSTLLHVNMNGEARVLRQGAIWLERPVPSPDGKYLAFGAITSNSNAWMMERF